MTDEDIFPMKIGEKNIDYFIDSAPNNITGQTRKDLRIKICYYLDTALFCDITYRVRKLIRHTTPLSQRVPVYAIYDSNFLINPNSPYKSVNGKHLNKEEMKNVVWNIQQDIDEEIENEIIISKAISNSGNCIICKEQQTHTTMSIGNHICNGCVAYIIMVYEWLRTKVITTHKLVDEGRYVFNKDDNRWIMNIHANETSPYWLHELFEGVTTD